MIMVTVNVRNTYTSSRNSDGSTGMIYPTLAEAKAKLMLPRLIFPRL